MRMARDPAHLRWYDRNLCSGSIDIAISQPDCAAPCLQSSEMPGRTSLAGLPISLNATGTGTPDIVSNVSNSREDVGKMSLICRDAEKVVNPGRRLKVGSCEARIGQD